MSRPLVIFVDWSAGGHNASFLAKFCSAAQAGGADAAIVCIKELAAQLGKITETFSDYSNVTITAFEFPGFLPIRPRSLQLRLRKRFFQRRVISAIKVVERTNGRPASLIFFASMFEEQADDLYGIVLALPRAYAGLYLHPRQFYPELPSSPKLVNTMNTLLRHSSFRAVATLNEDLAEKFAFNFNKPAMVFPDIADETHEPNHPLKQRLRRFAGSSPLVVLAGYLGPWKGAALLAEISLLARASGICFAFVGTLPLEAFEARQRAIVERALNYSPNAFFHLERVPDGSCYNAVLDAADVVYCGFENFPFSSNTLTKAAILKKPVIVYDGHLMARRVREYRTGQTVAPGDADAVLDAIHRIVDDYPGWLASNQPRWQEYQEKHSSRALEQAFTSLLRDLQIASPN